MRPRARRIGLTSKSLFYAIAIHVIVAVLLVLNIEWPSHVASSSPPEPAPVQANVVSEAEIQKQMEAIQEKEEAEKQEQLEAQEELEEILNQKQQEEERLAKIKERQEQERREAEELAKQKEQERERLAKLKQQEEEERRQAEAEAERKRQEEAERKRQEEAERKRQEEAERQAEEERQRREAEERELAEKRERERQLQEQLERERLEARVDSALSQYIPIIKQKVSRNWNRPTSLRNNIEAHVTVRLSEAGEVISARIVKSSGNPVFDRSVENAVLKASPLPIPQERGVNEEFRSLKLIFKPEEMLS